MIKFFDLEIVNKNINFDGIFKEFIEDYEYVLGSYVEKFERKYSEYIGVNYCVGVGNGSDGLQIALKALNISNDDKVATVSNAGFYSTAAINSVGAIPIFIDVNYDDQLIDLNDLEEKIKKYKVSALFITHLFGNIVDMDKVINLTKKYGVKTIEDCSHSHGIKIKNKLAGSYADVSVFSFYPTKNLGAIGDAGAVLTNSRRIYKNILSIRQYGWSKKYVVDNKFGQNSRIDGLQAAVLIKKLDFLEDMNKSRIKIVNNYQKNFSSTPLILFNQSKYTPNHLYVIRTSRRDNLLKFLNNNKIQTQIHYPIPDHKQSIMRYLNCSLPVTEKLSNEILSLPFYPYMPINIQNIVIENVQKFFKV